MLGDLTTNHVGSAHEWFLAAQSDTGSPSASSSTSTTRCEHGYECWYGVPSLPKLDYRSRGAAPRMYGGSSSVVRRWLESPYALDGWRIDVANMTGRLGASTPPRRSLAVCDGAVASAPDGLSSPSTRTTPAPTSGVAAGTAP